MNLRETELAWNKVKNRIKSITFSQVLNPILTESVLTAGFLNIAQMALCLCLCVA